MLKGPRVLFELGQSSRYRVFEISRAECIANILDILCSPITEDMAVPSIQNTFCFCVVKTRTGAGSKFSENSA